MEFKTQNGLMHETAFVIICLSFNLSHQPFIYCNYYLSHLRRTTNRSSKQLLDIANAGVRSIEFVYGSLVGYVHS